MKEGFNLLRADGFARVDPKGSRELLLSGHPS